MPTFLAQTSRGLVEVLQQELSELGFSKLEKTAGGVLFDTNWEGCYRANLWLRTASRVVMPVLDFPAYQNDELYNNIKKHDFTKYIEPSQTIAIDASVRDSKFRDQRFVALKVKDAIVDQFREKFGVRPDVDVKNADLNISVRCVKNQFSVAIDTSGEPLFKRGYRADFAVAAPMKEHLAAGLLRLAGWKPGMPLIDPMCGGGTILIEAAMWAANIAPGIQRRSFGFQRLKGFQRDIWKTVCDEAARAEDQATEAREASALQNAEKETATGSATAGKGDEGSLKPKARTQIFGFDWDRKALKVAREQAMDADVADLIHFQASPVGTLTNPFAAREPAERGILIVNPPYGHRLGTRDELEDTYKELGTMAKRQFAGWRMWIISPEAELTAHLRMKSTKRFVVFNGPLECRFLGYDVKMG
jgi:23S rRNA G2445 N2-methylase RlmL